MRNRRRETGAGSGREMEIKRDIKREGKIKIRGHDKELGRETIIVEGERDR